MWPFLSGVWPGCKWEILKTCLRSWDCQLHLTYFCIFSYLSPAEMLIWRPSLVPPIMRLISLLRSMTPSTSAVCRPPPEMCSLSGLVLHLFVLISSACCIPSLHLLTSVRPGSSDWLRAFCAIAWQFADLPVAAVPPDQKRMWHLCRGNGICMQLNLWLWRRVFLLSAPSVSCHCQQQGGSSVMMKPSQQASRLARSPHLSVRLCF